MSINQAARQGLGYELNVTPLVDVLLLLLIIFMVIVPASSGGESGIASQPFKSDQSARDAVVRVVFDQGDDQFKFTQISEVIGIGHAAGVDHSGLITPKVAAGLQDEFILAYRLVV